MNKKAKRSFIFSGVDLLTFIVFTILVKTVDVQPIGPNGSSVGFATMNSRVFDVFGSSELWFGITEGLKFVAFFTVAAFALIGILQLIVRKSIAKVDRDIIALGGIYVLTILVYILFEKVVINCRPIIVDGELAASYPSSHCMLSLVVFLTAVVEIRAIMKNETRKKILSITFSVLAAVAVIGRLLCGYHWFTDVIGSVFISATIIELFEGVVELFSQTGSDRKAARE